MTTGLKLVLSNIYILCFQPRDGWIGINDRDREGRWVWEESGKAATYFNWSPGTPNGWIAENCARMWLNGRWDDVVCDLIILGVDLYKIPVVCEKLLWL